MHDKVTVRLGHMCQVPAERQSGMLGASQVECTFSGVVDSHLIVK